MACWGGGSNCNFKWGDQRRLHKKLTFEQSSKGNEGTSCEDDRGKSEFTCLPRAAEGMGGAVGQKSTRVGAGGWVEAGALECPEQDKPRCDSHPQGSPPAAGCSTAWGEEREGQITGARKKRLE